MTESSPMGQTGDDDDCYRVLGLYIVRAQAKISAALVICMPYMNTSSAQTADVIFR